MWVDRSKVDSNQIANNMCNHNCSRCGSCCGLFIPFTEKELYTIKDYVKEHNIKPVNRINPVTRQFKAHCCFYDEPNQKCTIYEARPFACKDFKCDRKNWKEKRDFYEKRAKYNSHLSKKVIMGTFDDLIFNDYVPILRYILSMIPNTQKGIDSRYIINMFKHINRLDLLEQFKAIDENGNTINLQNLFNK